MVAQVTDNKDPEGYGRIKVKLLGYLTGVEVWLRMLNPYGSSAAGSVFLPEVDDEVLVLRGAEDRLEGMYILGALYNATRKPVYDNADGANITKQIKTKAGNLFAFSDKAGEEGITLQSKAGSKIVINDKSDTNGFTIANADGTISIVLDKTGASITVAKGQPATITVAGDATISADGKVTVKSGGDASVTAGGNLTVKGTANATLEAGAQLTVKGGAKIGIEAPMVEIKGATMVKIN